MGQNQVVGQHQATLKKFLLLERTKFLNPFRKQPPTNPLQSKSTRAISYAYGMIVYLFCFWSALPLASTNAATAIKNVCFIILSAN